MSRPLNILAIEPFYGGERRALLDALVDRSCHRWDVLTLPPRRIRHRLATAAHWFAEQLDRREPEDLAEVDVLFTSEAINLADLVRFCPPLDGLPAVAYFHCHHLPDAASGDEFDPAVDLANLATVAAATEVWFNSAAHARAFAAAVASLGDAHPDLRESDALARLARKARLVPPPIAPWATVAGTDRRPDLIFVDTAEPHPELLDPALSLLATARMPLSLVTVGPAIDLPGDFPRTHVDGSDPAVVAAVLARAGVFVGTRVGACFDELAVRALHAGCRPVLPDCGVYPELLADAHGAGGLYDLSPDGLAGCVRDALYRRRWPDEAATLAAGVARFDPATACRQIDERLSTLATAGRPRVLMPVSDTSVT